MYGWMVSYTHKCVFIVKLCSCCVCVNVKTVCYVNVLVTYIGPQVEMVYIGSHKADLI